MYVNSYRTCKGAYDVVASAYTGGHWLVEHYTVVKRGGRWVLYAGMSAFHYPREASVSTVWIDGLDLLCETTTLRDAKNVAKRRSARRWGLTSTAK